ncbi:MAG: polysaccharide pyruvyl transferase family protein [bacterium]
MHIQIEDYLRELAREREIVFLPNGGNAGDAMIACATYQLFQNAGITFTLFDAARFDPTDKVLIYGGGGNLVPLYPTARDILERYHQTVRRLIVLPHTIAGHQDLLERLGSHVDLLTREEVSYAYVRRVAAGPRIFLADDLALHLSPAALRQNWEGWPRMIARQDSPLHRKVQLYLSLARAQWRQKRTAGGKGGVLQAFRCDKERSRSVLPAGNIDVSRILRCANLSPLQAAGTMQMMCRLIDGYAEVRTDRLHVAIAAALLGKQVKLYANSYYKCEAVFRFSLAKRFPGVEWMEIGDEHHDRTAARS